MTAKPVWPDDGIILFDDECVLCSGWARFVAERDVDRRFRFTAIKSSYGRRLATLSPRFRHRICKTRESVMCSAEQTISPKRRFR